MIYDFIIFIIDIMRAQLIWALWKRQNYSCLDVHYMHLVLIVADNAE